MKKSLEKKLKKIQENWNFFFHNWRKKSWKIYKKIEEKKYMIDEKKLKKYKKIEEFLFHNWRKKVLKKVQIL